MNAHFTSEQSDALARSGSTGASFVDPATNQEYVVLPVQGEQAVSDLLKIKQIVDQMGGVDKMQAALEAVRDQHQELDQADVESIRRGIADMEAGRVMPANEAIAQMRAELDSHFSG